MTFDSLAFLVHPEILYVHGPPEPRVEQQIPSRVMIIVIHIHAIAVPFPIAAAIEVVRSNYPIGIVVQYDAARPVIDPARDKDFSHMPVAAARISPTGLYAVVVVVPVAIMRVLWIIPTFVLPIVVPVVAVFVLVLAFVLPFIAMVVAALPGCRDRQSPGQRHEQCPSNDFAHKSSLQRLRCRPTFFRLPHPIIAGAAYRRIFECLFLLSCLQSRSVQD